MPVHLAYLTGQPRLRRNGIHLIVDWVSTRPAGQIWQIYRDKNLAWTGTARIVRLPYPRTRTRIDVVGVDSGEGNVNYAASIPDTGIPADRATLTWRGGSYLSATLSGFRIYSSAVAGGAVDYSKFKHFVPLTVGRVALDGYGLGGYGQGGYGQSAASYSWRSGPLASGVWMFAVVPVDSAGNQTASPTTTSVTILAAPKPPKPNAAGLRLTYTFNAGTHVPTLAWLAAPP